MNNLLIMDDPNDWPIAIPGASVVSARTYLTDPAYGEWRSIKAFNLCSSFRYQSLGYYVSLLAEARGHKPLPLVSTMEDLQSQKLVRLITGNLDSLVQKSLAPIKSDTFDLSIYFGRNVATRYDALSHRLFSLLQSPLLRARFERCDERWTLRSMRAIAPRDVPAHHHASVLEAAKAYFSGHVRPAPRRAPPRFDLAILHDPDNPEPPSNPRAMRKFEKAARVAGLEPAFITRADLARLPEFDALFIRDTTFANHYTYRFSRQAAAAGLVVIDDPDSILKCNNKVYLAELLARHRLPAPRTLMVHRDNVEQIIPALGLPCVLKQPDSSFSIGVTKAESEQELFEKVAALLKKSDLIVAQEFIPTEFDWRVGILDRKPLFVCKYFMAAGHWQIVRHDGTQAGYAEGAVRAMPVAEAPEDVVKTALRATNLIGDGLYGVDIKQVGNRCCIIEVNDNPNIDAGNEDGVLKDALYREIMGSFARRVEVRKRVAP